VPPLEPAARDDNNSDHFDMDNLSLADILAEFDVHLVETLGEKNKSTVVQSATENSETKATVATVDRLLFVCLELI
jgi:hypothetical protein